MYQSHHPGLHKPTLYTWSAVGRSVRQKQLPMSTANSTSNTEGRGMFMVDAPCQERLQSADVFPDLQSQTCHGWWSNQYQLTSAPSVAADVIDDAAELVKTLRDNQDLQRELIFLLQNRHRDLLRLSDEASQPLPELETYCVTVHGVQLHAVQRRGSVDREGSAFPELLAHLSTHSPTARGELQALLTATEAFRGKYHVPFGPSTNGTRSLGVPNITSNRTTACFSGLHPQCQT